MLRYNIQCSNCTKIGTELRYNIQCSKYTKIGTEALHVGVWDVRMCVKLGAKLTLYYWIDLVITGISICLFILVTLTYLNFIVSTCIVSL